MESELSQDMRNMFEAACLKHLSFLFEKFGFKIVSIEKDNYGCFITSRNNTTAIRASFCPLDGRINFDFYRIVDNTIPKYPVFFDPLAELLVFNFDNVILVKGGTIVEQAQNDLFSATGIEKIVKQYSWLLKQYAIDLLSGDFSILPQIKKTIARRAKELEHEQ